MKRSVIDYLQSFSYLTLYFQIAGLCHFGRGLKSEFVVTGFILFLVFSNIVVAKEAVNVVGR